MLVSRLIYFYQKISTLVEKDILLDVEAGFFNVTDPNPIDKVSYKYVLFSYSPKSANHNKKKTLARP